MRFRRLLVLSLAALAAGEPGAADGPAAKIETRTAWGLHTTTFDTLQGRVVVHLPADAAAGDTLSGSVYAEPAGDDEETRDGNREKLSALVLAFAGARAEVGSGSLRATLPASLDEGFVPFALEGAGGTSVASAAVPASTSAAGSPPSLELPRVAQAGRPVSVRGAFDGDASTTVVTLGGEPLHVLAESPRRAVLQVPADALGVEELKVREGGEGGTGTTATGPLRVLAVQLSADALDLRRGQTTELRVRVSGLEGLEDPIPLAIRNLSPSVVRLQGGDAQTVDIGSGDVSAAGEFLWRATLVGITPGGFEIFASVPYLSQPEAAPPTVADALQDPAACACQRVELEDKTSPSTANTVRVDEWKPNGRPAGITLSVRRHFLHRIVCAGTRGKCSASTAWQVTALTVALRGVEIDGQPSPDLTSNAGQPARHLDLANPAAGYDDANAPRPTLTLGADCDRCREMRNAVCKDEKARNVSYRVDVRLPEAVLEKLRAGSSVTFSEVEIASRWGGMATNCGGVGFMDPADQPDHRKQGKPNFSGWKKGWKR